MTAIAILEALSRAWLLIDVPTNGEGVMPSGDPELIYVPYVGQPAGPETGPVNSLSTRGPEPDLGRRPRVLLIGDSITYGLGTPYEATFGKRLEDVLGGVVVNGGVTGYETWQARRRLEVLEPVVAPDAIVIQYFGNDRHRSDATTRRWARRQRIPRHLPVGPHPTNALLEVSSLARLVAVVRTRWYAESLPIGGATEGWRGTWRSLLRTAKDSTEVVLVLPSPTAQSLASGSWVPPRDLVDESLAVGAIVVNPAPALRAAGGDLYVDTMHYSARGHEVLADLLAQALRPHLANNR